MKKLFIIILLSISIIGCTTFNDVKEVKETIYQVSKGEVIHEIKSVELNFAELTIIDHSFNKLNLFIDKWLKVVSIQDFNEFSEEYKVAKNSYLSIHKVIEDNFDRYPEELKLKFIKYKMDANHIDSTVERLLLGRDIYRTGKEAVKLAMVVVGLLK